MGLWGHGSLWGYGEKVVCGVMGRWEFVGLWGQGSWNRDQWGKDIYPNETL